MNRITTSTLILTFAITSMAAAQEKYYAWSDQFEHREPGEFELESYSNFDTPTFSANSHFLFQRFELEYGFSDNLCLGINQGFEKSYPGGSASMGELGLEALYDFAPYRNLFVSPTVYIEYSRTWRRPISDQIEAKLILTKDSGRFGAILNGAVEYEMNAGSEPEPEMSGGMSYEITDGLRGGVEFFVTGSDREGIADADIRGTGIGPTVSFDTPWFSVASGLSFGIANEANKLNFRTIIGIDL